MPSIEYRNIDIGEIELIRGLWAELNAYHHERAGVFCDFYDQMTFETRKEYFEKKAATGLLSIILAFDREDMLSIGYIVSSFADDKTGEIESVFVTERYRSAGTGRALVTRALAWLDDQGSMRNRVSVAEGNGNVFDFYRKFGFYPRMTVLEQKMN